MSMIFSWVWMSACSEAFAAFTRSWSFVYLDIKPSSLGSLIYKARSSNTSSNFFRLPLNRPSANQTSFAVVSQTRISSDIAVGINAVASPNTLASLDELATPAAPVGFQCLSLST